MTQVGPLNRELLKPLTSQTWLDFWPSVENAECNSTEKPLSLLAYVAPEDFNDAIGIGKVILID